MFIKPEIGRLLRGKEYDTASGIGIRHCRLHFYALGTRDALARDPLFAALLLPPGKRVDNLQGLRCWAKRDGRVTISAEARTAMTRDTAFARFMQPFRRFAADELGTGIEK